MKYISGLLNYNNKRTIFNECDCFYNNIKTIFSIFCLLSFINSDLSICNGKFGEADKFPIGLDP